MQLVARAVTVRGFFGLVSHTIQLVVASGWGWIPACFQDDVQVADFGIDCD